MALVFQYGSNTSTTRLNSNERLGGAARPLGLARTTDGFDLAFTYDSRGNACAAADLVNGPERIYGVLYDIPDERVYRKLAKNGAKTLDQIEGTGYQRNDIVIELVKGAQIVKAITYTVIDRNATLRTAPHYVKHIVDGLRSHGAPREYIDYVKRRAIANNPDQADGFRTL